MDLDVVSSDRLHQYYLPAGAIMPGQLQVPFTLLSIAHRRHHARQSACPLSTRPPPSPVYITLPPLQAPSCAASCT